MGVVASTEGGASGKGDEEGATAVEDSATLPHGHAARTTRTHLVCLCRAHNKFAVLFFHEMHKDGKRLGNVVHSPLAICLGLGMAYLGAEGHTREEMYRAFNLGAVQDYQLLASYAAIHWDILRSTMPKGCVLEAAIRMFAQMEYKMTNEYEEILTNYEISRIRHVDFKERTEMARKDINKWVEDRTRGRIQEMIAPGLLDSDTRLFLVCAVYMRAEWYHQFDIKRTCKTAFHLPAKETIEVCMMNQHNTFRIGHLSKLDCDVLELPFATGHMRMYVLLPKKLDGIQRIEAKLTRNLIETMEDNLIEDYVDVFLPKFRFEQGNCVESLLAKVGIKEVFNPAKCDLSGIDGSHDLYLSRVFHHIYFEIEEVGHESSVTSVHDVGAFDIKPKRIFKADHPFVFYIRDERTGSVILMGRMVRPQLQG